MAIKNTRRNTVYGYPSPQAGLFPDPIVAARSPLTSDMGEIGQTWVNTQADTVFTLVAISGGQANWVQSGGDGGAGNFSSLTVNPGPINLTGTTNITGDTTVTGTLTSTLGFETIDGSVTAGNTDNSNVSSNLQVLKSRNNGVITLGDQLGNLVFAGFDGTGYTTGGAITCFNSGSAISANRIGGTLNFFTHTDTATPNPTLRMSIDQNGIITMAVATGGTTLQVSGGIEAVTGSVTIAAAGSGVILPGPVQVISGAGAPATGLALHIGDLYINTTAASATTRLYIATAVGTWTNVTCAA